MTQIEEVPSWLIDESLERERQEEFIRLIWSYGDANREVVRLEQKHWDRFQSSHADHNLHECAPYMAGWEKVNDLAYQIIQKARQ